MLGRHEEAIQKLRNARDCKEKFLFMGFSLRRKRRYAEAVESFRRAKDFGLESLTVHLETAATLREAKDPDAAAQEIEACANFKNVS